MSTSTFRPLRWLARLGLATACGPAYQLALKPARATNLFAEGREQARAVVDSLEVLEVRLSFVGYEPTRVVCEAEYRNPNTRALVGDLAAFCYEANRPPAPAPVAGQQAKRPKPLPGAEVNAAANAAANAALPLLSLPLRPVAAFDPDPEITTLCYPRPRNPLRAEDTSIYRATPPPASW